MSSFARCRSARWSSRPRRPARPAGAAARGDRSATPTASRSSGPARSGSCAPTPARRLTAEPPPPPAARGRRDQPRPPHRPMFAPDAHRDALCGGRVRRRARRRRGFASAVAFSPGRTRPPLQRLAAAGDFGNGISAELSWDDYVFINPDLTLYIERAAGRRVDLPAVTYDARPGRGRASPRACCSTSAAASGARSRRCWCPALGPRAGRRPRTAPRRGPRRYLSRKALMRTSYCWASRE